MTTKTKTTTTSGKGKKARKPNRGFTVERGSLFAPQDRAVTYILPGHVTVDPANSNYCSQQGFAADAYREFGAEFAALAGIVVKRDNRNAFYGYAVLQEAKPKGDDAQPGLGLLQSQMHYLDGHDADLLRVSCERLAAWMKRTKRGHVRIGVPCGQGLSFKEAVDIIADSKLSNWRWRITLVARTGEESVAGGAP